MNASVEDFQPIRPIRPRPKRPNLLVGCSMGIVGSTAFVLLVLVALNALFPPHRLNVLLLGTDTRPGDSGPARTDTLILATVNPEGPYLGMLSIPRDLWVQLPDGSESRINTAHFFAEITEPGTGPAATADTVAANFGVTVERYARIDFAGFVRIVDALGGITIDVPTPIEDYEYPTYDYGTQVIRFATGEQRLNGEQALQYARTRHGSSDFDRAARQQAIIVAIGQRVLQPATWPRLPLAAIAALGAIQTNITSLEMIRLLPTLLAVGPSGVDGRIVEGNMTQPFTTSGGAAVLLPVWSEINPVLLVMFGQ
ncbi:MAG: LCP family protein [Chloroflexi bacterium]|nr:LCP family protein [Chloroflexota bacterium]